MYEGVLELMLCDIFFCKQTVPKTVLSVKDAQMRYMIQLLFKKFLNAEGHTFPDSTPQDLISTLRLFMTSFVWFFFKAPLLKLAPVAYLGGP